MTVQDIINRLEQIEDKDKECVISVSCFDCSENRLETFYSTENTSISVYGFNEDGSRLPPYDKIEISFDGRDI